MVLRNESPTKAEKEMFVYGLYLSKSPDQEGGSYRYVACHKSKTEDFPTELVVEEEEAFVELGSDSLRFENVSPDVGLLSLIRARLQELNFSNRLVAMI